MRAPSLTSTTSAATAAIVLVVAALSVSSSHAFIPPSSRGGPLPASQRRPQQSLALARARGQQQQPRGQGAVGMLLNLNKKESTAPPFATEAERENDPGIKVGGVFGLFEWAVWGCGGTNQGGGGGAYVWLGSTIDQFIHTPSLPCFTPTAASYWHTPHPHPTPPRTCAPLTGTPPPTVP